MKSSHQPHLIGAGLAMFSMFFGAGNVVFPLAMGQYAQDDNLYAILGLLITAVAMPFTGLIAMTLYEGNYQQFFGRIGKIPGFILALCMMGLIGPFGAIPRCVALSYSTLKVYLPNVSLSTFSLFSCCLIFAFTIKRNRILDLLGYFLTPILLISLATIIIKGIFSSSELPQAEHSSLSIFFKGMKEGYQTMDLLAAFFFSSVVLVGLKKDLFLSDQQDYKKLFWVTFQASCIGAFLLSVVYIGFSFVAAYQSHHLMGIATDELISALSIQILGEYGGIIASVAVALACLTTAIALATVFAEFLYEDITQFHLRYEWSLVLTLIITYYVSTFNFGGIAAFLKPILQVCYPALILLSFLNILYKLYGFKVVKAPVFLTFLISLIYYSLFFTSN